MNTSRFFLVLGAALSMTVIGCGGVADDQERLAVDEAELGEIGCATVGGVPYAGSRTNGSTQVAPSSCSTTVALTSLSTSYDNGYTCSEQFVSEVTGLAGRKFSVLPNWRQDYWFLDSSNCQNAEVEYATYYRNASTHTWTTHTTKIAFAPVGTSCLGLPVTGSSFPPAVNGTEGYDMVRVAAKATYTIPAQHGRPAIVYKVPTKIDIKYPPSPC